MYTKSIRVEEIKGWGNYPKAFARVFRPERTADLYEIVCREKKLLARGGGRSYGDASMNIDGINIDMKRLNKMLQFDEKSGILLCQSGVTMKEIIEVFLPKGWIPGVTPGTKFSTVGGCVACNAHGKNWKDGAFCNYVPGFSLMLYDGSIIYCDANGHNSDIYYSTIGGMGMTGIITEAYLQLKKVNSSYVEVENVRFNNLKELFDLIYDSMESYEYLFTWLDSRKEGRAMGRGFLQRGIHSDDEKLQNYEQRTIPLPFNLPGFVINRYSVKTFNSVYYLSAGFENQEKRLHLMDFFYPLDSISNWNRVYGKNGFVEYQAVVPSEGAYDVISELLKVITRSKLGSIVAALKPLTESEGIMSFPVNGFTLAVDFPVNKKLWPLLDELDRIVIEARGRVYLAKDSRLSADHFRKMYSKSLDTWESTIKKYNIENKFSSQLFDRLSKF